MEAEGTLVGGGGRADGGRETTQRVIMTCWWWWEGGRRPGEPSNGSRGLVGGGVGQMEAGEATNES